MSGSWLEGNTMIKIKGKINTAICYANIIEDLATEQMWA